MGLVLFTLSLIPGLWWFVAVAQAKGLKLEIQALREEVSSLKKDQTPSIAINRFRNSVCYIVGT